ncbi:MAG: hypothetical protein U9P42_09545 [Candidatus Fermentibacteria bacterium]|nr:hypothetical protein [Candidatus Fermentibacteria bacterium]
MYKKEFIASLKQTAAILSFLLLIPIIHQVNEMRLPGGTSSLGTYMMNGGFLCFALLIAGLAYMMFSSEDNDDALEYLKTLPISKWELLKIKVIPRLSILLIPALAVIISVALQPSITAIELYLLVVAPVLLSIMIALMSGFFLGLSDRKNPILIGSMTLLTSYPIFFGSIVMHRISRYIVHRTQAEIPVYLYALVHLVTVTIPVLIPLFLLIPVYRSWDCTSGKVRSQAILKRLAVPSILIVILWGVL